MEETFEHALEVTEREAAATQRAGDAVVKASKHLWAAARSGDVNAIERALSLLRDAATHVAQQSANTAESWRFDLGGYARSGGLKDEIFARAEAEQLRLVEQDGKIFSYPSILRLIVGADGADCTLQIDKKPVRTLRPSYLVEDLKKRRDAKPKFNFRAFLRALYKTYRQQEPGEHSIALMSIYDLWALAPGFGRDYSRQEFARDIALLDLSGENEIDGRRMRLAASTATKTERGLLRVIDKDGRELVYYAISFEVVAP